MSCFWFRYVCLATACNDQMNDGVLEFCEIYYHVITLGGHPSRDKTLEKVSERFYWKPNMTGDIKAFIFSCDVCQRVSDKFVKPSATLHPIPVESEFWQQVFIHLCTCNSHYMEQMSSSCVLQICTVLCDS